MNPLFLQGPFEKLHEHQEILFWRRKTHKHWSIHKGCSTEYDILNKKLETKNKILKSLNVLSMFYSRIDKPLILKKYDITQRQRKRAINSPSQKRFFSDFFSFFNFFFFFFVVVKSWCRKATFTNIIKTDNLHLQFTAVFTETSKSISFKSKLNTAWKLSAFGNIKSQQPLKSYQSFKNLNKIQKRLQQIHSFLKLITNWLHVAVMSYERKKVFLGWED